MLEAMIMHEYFIGMIGAFLGTLITTIVFMIITICISLNKNKDGDDYVALVWMTLFAIGAGVLNIMSLLRIIKIYFEVT